MMYQVLAQADGEAIAASLWYEERRPSLGDDFLAELHQAFAMLSNNARGQPLLEYYTGPHETRRYLLRRFPYSTIYLCRPDNILVVAIAHHRRRPLYGLDRLVDGSQPG